MGSINLICSIKLEEILNMDFSGKVKIFENGEKILFEELFSSSDVLNDFLFKIQRSLI